MSQVASLLAFINLKPGDRALELGCGNGAMADYIAEHSGAHLTGIDYIPEAIRQANQRTRGRGKRLAFKVMDIGALNFPPESFDTIISIDTLYFTEIIIDHPADEEHLETWGADGHLLFAWGFPPQPSRDLRL